MIILLGGGIVFPPSDSRCCCWSLAVHRRRLQKLHPNILRPPEIRVAWSCLKLVLVGRVFLWVFQARGLIKAQNMFRGSGDTSEPLLCWVKPRPYVPVDPPGTFVYDSNPERLLVLRKCKRTLQTCWSRKGIGGDLEQVFLLINRSHQSNLSVPSRIPDRRLTCVPALCARCQQIRNPPAGVIVWCSSIVSKQRYSGRARDKNLRWSDSSP